MVNNYNIKLLRALHSVFWYQGLLEQEGNEWITFPGIITRPKYTKDSVIIKLIDELKVIDRQYTYQDILRLCIDFEVGREFNVIWIMLVEMFGNCGTSPRTGWIEDCKACAEFLEQVVEIEERDEE